MQINTSERHDKMHAVRYVRYGTVIRM
jgi:hypothetical protein